MTTNQAKTIGRTFALLIKGGEHPAAEIVIDAFRSKLFGLPNEQREELAAAFNQGSDEFFAEQ